NRDRLAGLSARWRVVFELRAAREDHCRAELALAARLGTLDLHVSLCRPISANRPASAHYALPDGRAKNRLGWTAKGHGAVLGGQQPQSGRWLVERQRTSGQSQQRQSQSEGQTCREEITDGCRHALAAFLQLVLRVDCHRNSAARSCG